MNFNLFNQAQEFETLAKPFLSENEDVYSLFYGILQGIKAGRYDNPLMVTIEDDGKLVALFQMTPPHPLNIVIIDEGNRDAILSFAAEEFFKREIHIPSAVGLKPVVFSFAEKWKELQYCDSKLLMDQGLYRLDEVNQALDSSPGSWRYARKDEAPLIEEWYVAFGDDTGIGNLPIEEIRERVAQFLEDQEVFFWEVDGKVVSMMKKARPSDHGVTVSFVFTPKEERKKGYARTMVAAGSEELLKTYNFCVLYTDMMNPTSNKIYQEIGYRKIADSVHLEFVPKEGE
ncbi:GNAT family N-acetyltransferase [Paenisporosarcina indica]|uniref:GNAT family N-acetyltransferase n=1 Tax=Paenisporosarcina indica TaxID=650093 RepID=UPI00094F78FF|nr:GNAT family N-acetyltransferase [Paenisporosarcina indica]